MRWMSPTGRAVSSDGLRRRRRRGIELSRVGSALFLCAQPSRRRPVGRGFAWDTVSAAPGLAPDAVSRPAGRARRGPVSDLACNCLSLTVSRVKRVSAGVKLSRSARQMSPDPSDAAGWARYDQFRHYACRLGVELSPPARRT